MKFAFQEKNNISVSPASTITFFSYVRANFKMLRILKFPHQIEQRNIGTNQINSESSPFRYLQRKNERYHPPGQALAPGGFASFAAPRGGVCYLAIPALARQWNHQDGSAPLAPFGNQDMNSSFRVSLTES